MRIVSLAIVLGGKVDWIIEQLERTQTFCVIFCGDSAASTARFVTDRTHDLITYAGEIPGGLYEKMRWVVQCIRDNGIEAERIIVFCEATRALEIGLLIQHISPMLQTRGKPRFSIEASSSDFTTLREDLEQLLETQRRVEV